MKKLILAVVTVALSSCTWLFDSSSHDSSHSSMTSEESVTSEIIDLSLKVNRIQNDFVSSPMVSQIYVTATGAAINETMLLRGSWQIANQFYRDSLDDIQLNHLDLTILMFSDSQTLEETPEYGTVLFVINENMDSLGIQLIEERIVLE